MTKQVQLGGYPKASGLQWCITQKIHPKTGAIITKVLGVVCRQNSKDRGILLNVCPWCGEAINWSDRPVVRRPKKTTPTGAPDER